MAVEHGLAALARTMAATPRAPIPTFEWATVVAGTGEVHVVLDSDPTGTPRPVSDNAAGPVAVGQRVHVAHHGLTLTLLSAPDPHAVPRLAAGRLDYTAPVGTTTTSVQLPPTFTSPPVVTANLNGSASRSVLLNVSVRAEGATATTAIFVVRNGNTDPTDIQIGWQAVQP